MLQFTTEIILCYVAIICLKAKEEIALFEHQAGLPFEVEAIELFAHLAGEMLEEEVLSQKIKRKKDCPKP